MAAVLRASSNLLRASTSAQAQIALADGPRPPSWTPAMRNCSRRRHFSWGRRKNLIQLNNFNGTGLTTSGASPSTVNDPLKIEQADLFDVGATQVLFGSLKLGIDLYYKF